MKKSILFTCLALLSISLTAFGLMNYDKLIDEEIQVQIQTESQSLDEKASQNTSNFTYAMGTRFGARISKQDLHNATTVLDIVPKDTDWSISPIKKVYLSLWREDNENTAPGDDVKLNDFQKQMMGLTDYNDNIKVVAKCDGINHANGETGEYDMVYYLTVVPEREAHYKQGQDALMNYFSDMSFMESGLVDNAKLQSGRIDFIVNKEGNIKDAELSSSCGYEHLDNRMMELLKSAPGEWESAENEKGEKVDQKLSFFFGSVGC